MKRIISLLLVLLVLMTCACDPETIGVSDKNVFEMFMTAVSNKQFIEAYSFISAKVAPSNSADSSITPGENTISQLDFESFYNRVLNVFRINGIRFNKTGDETVGESRRNISYTVTYNCEEAGELSFDCEMPLVAEDGVWRVLWQPSVIFPDLEWGEQFGRATLPAKRGDILTRDGTVIAETVHLVTVYAVFSEIVDYSEIAKRIAAAEGITEEEASEKVGSYLSKTETLHKYCAKELNDLYNSLYEIIEFDDEEPLEKSFKSVVNDFMMIRQFRPDAVDSTTLEALKAIPGIHIDTKNYGTARLYPYGSLLAHNLGYVGSASEEEVRSLNEGRAIADGLYTTDSIVGKSGIERLYETKLRGKDGFYYYIRNDDGSIKKVLYRKERENGLDVHLTIDFDLQKRTEELLDIVLYGDDTSGAVIVMNPVTGMVEAMASYPTFDLNKFVTGFSAEEYKALSEQANTPFLDRTKRGLYPPGSTFKVFTAAAALDSKTMTADYEFRGWIDEDYWTPTGYGPWIWPRIKRTQVNNRTLPLNMTNCMLHSDNIYFANCALMMGAETFVDYLNGLGMSSSLPFELTTARTQVIGDMASMNFKMLADTGYGQGQVLVTPLQLATMFCAMQNGGDMPVPRITDSFYRTEGVNYECVERTEYSVWIEDAISDQTISIIRPMLEGVVDPTKNGTGRSLRVTNVDVAGKTGSAEIGGDKSRIISWFAGYRENVDPEDERVVIVMLDVPDLSPYTTLKFQIARELLKFDDTPDPNAPPENNGN